MTTRFMRPAREPPICEQRTETLVWNQQPYRLQFVLNETYDNDFHSILLHFEMQGGRKTNEKNLDETTRKEKRARLIKCR